MDGQQSLEPKSLSEVVETQERLIIQQQNETIYLVNQNNAQHKQNINQFKDELIKVLKQFILNQNDTKQQIIQDLFMINHENKLNGTTFEGLKFQKHQGFLEDYINLMLSLQNKQEEFMIEIANPFNQKKVYQLEMQAQKMINYQYQENICTYCEGKIDNQQYYQQLSVDQSIEQIKKYGLYKIKIDNIYIYNRLIRCCHQNFQTEYHTHINLCGIECNNVEIKAFSQFREKYTLDYSLIIQNPLKLLKINKEESSEIQEFPNEPYKKYELNLDITFLNETSNISKLEVHLPEEVHLPAEFHDYSIFDEEVREYEDIYQYKINDIFKYKQILEIEIYIQQAHYGLFQCLLKVDLECERFIFFSIISREYEFVYFKNFINLINQINYLRYQLTLFNKVISPFLTYSPTFTFLDLHEDFLLN